MGQSEAFKYENLRRSYSLSSNSREKIGREQVAIKSKNANASVICQKAYVSPPANVKKRELRAFRDWYGRWAYSLTTFRGSMLSRG